MSDRVYQCKSCGIVFDTTGITIDKCTEKRLYCELCLAQQSPQSTIEQKIRKRYIQIVTLSAFIILTILMFLKWENNKYETFFDYFIGFGVGYVIIWVFTSILLLPILMLMKKPRREEIKKEKETYIDTIENKKESRKIQMEQQEKGGAKESGE